jgi:hypothetical protein
MGSSEQITANQFLMESHTAFAADVIHQIFARPLRFVSCHPNG